MPSVSHDGRSFMIDGRRIWLVSGRIPYARIPRDQWQQRILAAKHAGLNTIETPVFWSRHEPRPGKFDFTGDSDLRHFVDLVGKAGMYCILGLGPFVGAGVDFGGLPPWLRELNLPSLRAANNGFLECCSRFFTAVSDQIKGWQATAPGSGGPIVLLQIESQWTCGNDQLAQSYLGELTRYVREAGLNVPVINSNNLWCQVEGQIDGWVGAESMLTTMRQLASVRPGNPRVVIDLSFAPPTVWGKEPAAAPGGAAMLRTLAQVLAGGGQFNISTWCGGTNFGFSGGRLASGTDHFATTAVAHGHLFDEAGVPDEALGEVRKIALAASRFGRVFANLDHTFHPVCLEPDEGGEGRPRTCAVVHVTGAQGGVAFVFGAAGGKGKPELLTPSIMMADGSALPVPVMSDGTAWCLLDVNVSGRARLDYANVSALGSVGQVLVLFGPAGATALVSVNGSPVEADIPEGDEAPVVLPHEGLTLVFVSGEQARRVYFTDDAVMLGVEGVTAAVAGIPAAGAKHWVRISGEGVVKTMNVDAGGGKTRGGRVVMQPWQMVGLDDYLGGTSARYATIQSPKDLGALGCPNGYGWYRLTPRESAGGKVRVILPHAGDRLHFFADGVPLGVVGAGADRVISLPWKKGGHHVVVLAENFGRFAGGPLLGEGKGIYGPVYEVSPLKLGKPRIEAGRPVDVLSVRAPLWEVSEGDATSPDRITWVIPHKHKTPVVMCLDAPPEGAVLLVNDTPAGFLDRSGPATIVLTPEQLSKNSNLVQVALMGHGRAEEELKTLTAGTHFEAVERDVLEACDLAFAKWEPPVGAAFEGRHHHAAGTPAWHRCTFTADREGGPLAVIPAGMTKGQVFVNGRHLCRYYVGSPTGKRLPPQDRYLIPASWLVEDGPNELVLFDEHGGHPSKCRVARW